MVARGALAVIAIFILLGARYCSHYANKPVLNGITLLFMLNTVYYVMCEKEVHGSIIGTTNTFGYFANIFLNLGVFFAAYWMSRLNKINDRDMLHFFFFMFFVSILRYVTEMTTSFETYNTNRTLNVGYLLVSLFPYLILVKKKYLSIPILLLLFFLILSCVKRGAIIIFVLSTLYYMKVTLFQKGFKHFFVALLSLVVVSVVGYFLVGNVLESNELLMKRYEMTMEGFTNGRDDIFSAIWNAWLNSDSIINILFGFGFCSSVSIAGIYAHNDWLELLSTAGLLGVIIYAIFIFQLASFTRKNNLPSDYKHILVLSLIAIIITSLTSMYYCDVDHIILTLLVGYVVGADNRSFNIIKK